MLSEQPVGILGMLARLGLELARHRRAEMRGLLLEIGFAALGTVHLIPTGLEHQSLEIFSAIAADVFVDGHEGRADSTDRLTQKYGGLRRGSGHTRAIPR